MKPQFRVTYDVVTEESAKDGDYAELGFYSRGGWKHDDPSDWTLHDLVSEFGRGGFQDGGRSFYSSDSEPNYRTGDQTSYGIHPPERITPASYARLKRIFCQRVR